MVVYICEAVLILIGNSITVYIFWTIRKRLKRTSYLLINLAVADILVGIAVILWFLDGIAVIMERELSSIVVKTALIVDAIGTVSSILSLVQISLERMLAILWPFRHRTVKTWCYHVSTSFIWFVASLNGIVNASIDLYSRKRNNGLTSLTAITIICSVLIIICAYLAIWISTKRNRFRNNTCRSMEQNTKLAKTLFIVTALSVITCLPSGISLVLRDYLHHPYSFRVQITIVAQYANSFLNPVVYCLKMPEFKESVKKLLCRCPRPRRRLNGTSSDATNGIILRSVKTVETL